MSPCSTNKILRNGNLCFDALLQIDHHLCVRLLMSWINAEILISKIYALNIPASDLYGFMNIMHEYHLIMSWINAKDLIFIYMP